MKDSIPPPTLSHQKKLPTAKAHKWLICFY